MLSFIKKRFYQTLKKKFYPMFEFKQRHNITVGGPETLLDCIVHAAIVHDFIENSIQILKSKKRMYLLRELSLRPRPVHIVFCMV